MDSVALDASAILAQLQGEPGGSEVMDVVDGGAVDIVVSSVNLCEAITKLMRDGLSAREALEAVVGYREFVVGFDEGQAIRAAELSARTQSFGLSLGDRACLALAASRGCVAWTTDRAWMSVDVGVRVRLLRS